MKRETRVVPVEVHKHQGCLIRSKYTRALFTYISIRMLRSLRRTAEEAGHRPVMEIEFSGHMYYPREKWVMIPAEDFWNPERQSGEGGLKRRANKSGRQF